MNVNKNKQEELLELMVAGTRGSGCLEEIRGSMQERAKKEERGAYQASQERIGGRNPAVHSQ